MDMATIEAMLDKVEDGYAEGYLDEGWESSRDGPDVKKGGQVKDEVYCEDCQCVVNPEGHLEVCAPLKAVMEVLALCKDNEFVRQRLWSAEGAGRGTESVEVQLLRVSMELTGVVREMSEFKDDVDGPQTELEEVAREGEVSELFKRVRGTYAGVAGKAKRSGPVVEVESGRLWKQLREIGQEWKEYCGERSSLTYKDVRGVDVS